VKDKGGVEGRVPHPLSLSLFPFFVGCRRRGRKRQGWRAESPPSTLLLFFVGVRRGRKEKGLGGGGRAPHPPTFFLFVWEQKGEGKEEGRREESPPATLFPFFVPQTVQREPQENL